MKLSNSFEKGFGRAIDLFGRKKDSEYAINGAEKDALALRGDWENIGKAIAESVRKYGENRK